MSATKFRAADFLCAAAGVPASLVFLVLGGLASGGGHSVAAMTVFFPYGTIFGLLLEDTNWEFVAAITFVLQFPFYGFAAARALGGGRPALLLATLGAHVVAAVAALKFLL